MNKKGYTLVELIITLAVIGIMVVPIFNTFLQSNRINVMSKREIAGAYVAQNVMEELKTMTASQLTDRVNADASDAIRLFTRDSGRTTFTVQVEVTDVTNTLGINLDSTVVVQPNIPNADVTVTLPSAGNNGLIDFTNPLATDITFNDLSTNLLFMVSDSGSSVAFDYSSFSEDFDVLTAGDIQLNIVGPTSGTLLDWQIDLINLSSDVLNVTIVNDIDNHVGVGVSDVQSSTNDIWISNTLPSVNGDVRAAKSWYQVVVQVVHDGIVYEVLESTIGK
jgi:prepilin-type N-terminal cleavage/methylation domain-containing protein